MRLKRYEGNPILTPIEEHPWESLAVFNCAAVYLNGKVHLVYRGRDKQRRSMLGYAVSEDGFTISERLPEPIYRPTGEIDKYGVEDPRISIVGDRLFMSYTAFGETPGVPEEVKPKVKKSVQIAFTTISIEDFINKRWNWSKPFYPFPGVDNKGAIIFPEKIKGKYVMYHRIRPHIWIAYSDNLIHWKDSNIIFTPQYEWEYLYLGTGAPPIKTDYGWLIIYHASDRNKIYRLGYFIADLEDPSRIIYRHPEPILEPEEDYEKFGDVPNIVFTCGAVLIDDTVFVYYGGADTVIAVATAKLDEFLQPVRLWGVL